MMSTSSLPPLPLPAGVNSSYIDTTTSFGLLFHILSSEGSNSTGKPLILLLHGAPELAFTWRHIIVSSNFAAEADNAKSFRKEVN